MDNQVIKLRNVTKIKFVFMLTALFFPVILLGILQPLADEIGQDISWFPSFLRYFIFVSAVLIISVKLSVYFKILKNEQYAKQVLVKRKDEREIFIRSKTYAFTFKLVIYLLTLAIIVTSFIDVYIFATLLIVFIGMWAAFYFTNIYYNKKY